MEGIAIWVALKNVVPEETFTVLTGSHLFSQSPQELAATQSLNIYDEEEVLKAAQQINPESTLLHLNIKDGEYILFDGKLWHGTKNTTKGKRYALNFRYARPGSKIRISKDGALPNVAWDKNLPLCLLVHGQDREAINTLIPAKKISWRKGFITGLFYYFPLNVLEKLRELLFNS
jgi:hypothetical protein